MLWIALAGPGSNLLLALIFGIACRLLGITSLHSIGTGIFGLFQFMMAFGMMINIVLAVFNLLPFPPLDGSKILFGLLPKKYEKNLYPLMQYGPVILIGLIALGYVTKYNILWMILRPFIRFFSLLFAGADLGF